MPPFSTMTSAERVVFDLSARCLAYNLMRKYPRRSGVTVEDVQATAIKWGNLLELEPETAEVAFYQWQDMTA